MPLHIRKQIRLTPEQERAIRMLAAERDIDQSEIIREAIDQYLKAGK
jgi:predicted transcriptional regulator